jgi:hypothetical protein
MWDQAPDTPSLSVVSAAAFIILQLQDLTEGFAESPLAAREEALLHFVVERTGCLFLDSHLGNPTSCTRNCFTFNLSFMFFHVVQTNSGFHPTSSLIGTGGFPQG